MNALQKTLKRYFVTDDGYLSLGALSIVAATLVIFIGNVVQLWPIDGNDLVTIGKWLSGGGAAIGLYRRVGKK